MRCINKKRQIAALLLAACLTASLTSGCGQTAQLTDAFSSDHPEYGIQSGDDNTEIPYFAKDLCVAEGDAEEIEADTSEAGAALFFNIDTKEVLYAKNIYERLYPASTTKLMTALVALKNGDLDAQTTVSQESVTFHESGVSTAKLKAGDVLTLRQLLYALLLPSANDAANVIAEQIAGSQDQFVAMMNAEAKEIGATGSHFVNANGLHDENHYTTAYDLYLIFQAAMQYDDFMEIIQQKEYTGYLHRLGRICDRGNLVQFQQVYIGRGNCSGWRPGSRRKNWHDNCSKILSGSAFYGCAGTAVCCNYPWL